MQIPKLLQKVLSQITQQVTNVYARCIITVFVRYFTQFGTERIFKEMKTKIFFKVWPKHGLHCSARETV